MAVVGSSSSSSRSTYVVVVNAETILVTEAVGR